MTIGGSCLCGDVAFEVEGPFEPLAHCHCSMCRKAHGAAFASYVAAPASAFRWRRGAELVKSYESSPGARRAFCPRCGSSVPGEPVGEQRFVPAGLLDGDPKVGPLPHIFVASKAPWYEIADDAPRFDAYPPGMGEALPTKRVTEPAPGVLRGGCLCGAVAYETPRLAPTDAIVRCHCTRCRKARAAAHNANFFVPRDRFRWLRGEERLRHYKVPEAERFTQAFCGDCGSPQPAVFMRAVVPAGTLDDDPRPVDGAHIFVGSKAPWFEIRDSLPQYVEYRPA